MAAEMASTGIAFAVVDTGAGTSRNQSGNLGQDENHGHNETDQ